MSKKEIQSIIDLANKQKWKTCIYGMGRLGRNFGIRIFTLLGLNADYVTDANLCNDEDFRKVKYISVGELCSTKQDMFVIICVGARYHEEIEKKLKNNKLIHYVFFQDVIGLDSVINSFYGTDVIYDRKRVAVFTCITGGYDTVLEPMFKSDECDFYLISDTDVSRQMGYQFISINDVAPSELNDKDKNRYCKMHGFEIFKDYDYSIYVDGSIRVIGDIKQYIKEVGFSGLAMLKHPYHDCIYEEGIKNVAAGNADEKMTIDLLRRYMNEGMPRHFGLFECGIVVSETCNKMGQVILKSWYEEYMKSRLRDQFSLPYVLWKMNFPLGTVGYCDGGRDVRKSDVAVKQVSH